MACSRCPSWPSCRPGPRGWQALVEKGVAGSRRALALASDPASSSPRYRSASRWSACCRARVSGATLGLRADDTADRDRAFRSGVAESLGVGVVVTLITYASLIVGELVPKQIALRDPEAVARQGRAGDDAAREDLLAAGRGCSTSPGKASAVAARPSRQDRPKASPRRRSDAGRRSRDRRRARAGREGDDRRRDAARRPPGARRDDAAPRRRHDRPDARATGDPRGLHRKHRIRACRRTRAIRDDPLGIVQAKDLLDAFMRGGTPDIRALVRQAPVIPDIARRTRRGGDPEEFARAYGPRLRRVRRISRASSPAPTFSNRSSAASRPRKVRPSRAPCSATTARI